MRIIALPLVALTLSLGACADANDSDASGPAQRATSADPVEAGANEGPMPGASTTTPVPTPATAPAEPAPDAIGSENRDVLEKSIPVALRGKWRETSGAAPTAAQCQGSSDGNIGKVLEVRDTGFSIFENGGRLMDVASRSPGSIRATYDTTYADTPTQADITMRVDPVARTLTMMTHGDGGDSRIYKRCPT